MKKSFFLLTLFISVSRQTIAQTTPAADKVFDLPADFFGFQYFIGLENGNSLRVEVNKTEDLAVLKNIDSLITSFLDDLALIDDSMKNELLVKKIEYLVERNARKKIRISVSKPFAADYLLRGKELSALKTAQDTVTIIGVIEKPASIGAGKPFSEIRYYRLQFLLNDIRDLRAIRETALGEKIVAAGTTRNAKWRRDKNGDWHIIGGDPDISAKRPSGNVSSSTDYLSSLLKVNITNYKNYFVPSFSVGFDLIINNARIKRTIGLSWEPSFVFKNDLGGKLKTYRNDFYTLAYREEPLRTDSKSFHFLPNASISFLKNQRGNVFDDNTFRLGIGQIKAFNDKITIEPGIYFNNFLKDVTPSVKISF